MQAIFPVLRYQNARQAIEWLGNAFGFEVLFTVPSEGEFVRHAQLKLSNNIVMLGSIREEDGLTTPAKVGLGTQALCVWVEDVNDHFNRAKEAGAKILASPAATDFGSYEYYAEDIEGHRWTFSDYCPVVDNASGQS